MQNDRQYAVKYRPKRLEDFVGQDAAIAQVQGILTKKLPPNCLLLCGQTGCGKSSLARVIGNTLVGKHKEDLHEITLGGERGIDAVREIIDKAHYAPKGKYSVFIIDEIAKATPQAFSPLLLALEEPPTQTIFILCTDEPERLPKTILGRCQKIFLANLPPATLKKLVLRVCKAERIKFGTNKIVQYIADNAGEARTALQMLEAAANAKATAKNYQTILKVLQAGQVLDLTAAKLLIGLYKNQQEFVFKVLLNTVEQIGLINAALTYNHLLMQQHFNGYVWQNEATKLLQKYFAKELPKLARLSHTHNVLVNVRRDLPTVSTFEQKHLLIARLGSLVFTV